MCVMLIYRKEVLDLLRKSEMFWKVSSSDNTGNKPVIWLLNVFGILLFYTYVLYIPNCLYFHILPVQCWSSEGYKYSLMAFLQFPWLLLTFVSAFGFNCFIVGLCTQLAIQFRILAFRIETTRSSITETQEEPEAVNDDMRTLVKYHLFLLE